jgi:hypothetical protein
MKRILDVTLTKPLLGRILGYGHFVFESAAQDRDCVRSAAWRAPTSGTT